MLTARCPKNHAAVPSYRVMAVVYSAVADAYNNRQWQFCSGLGELMVLALTFWLITALVVYVYFGYPLLLAIASRIVGPPPARAASTDPTVTLIISAFNEADCIEAKIENSLALDYPREKIDILVVSDASDDGTDDIVKRFENRGVRLLRMGQRSGKTLGLNAAAADSESDILVFSDANAMYRPDAVKRLAENFSDARIGAAIGESTYESPETASGQSESAYWRYEIAIKTMETRLGSVVGGDGAIYAVRRSLYDPMSADALSDFVNPLNVVNAGYRCVYEPAAVSYEDAADSFRKEYRRKVRIVNRAWRAMMKMTYMLNPFRHGWFSLKLWSHKLLRWLVPFFLLAIFALNLLLLDAGPIYVVTLGAQLVFYALAFAGYLLRENASQPFVLRVPFYFCLVNIAAAVGIAESLIGKSYTTWATARAGE